jgi:Zn-dependent peptidase ImmA (M78 family)/transcriptional regulator with XRE-family HTH domain
MDGDRDPNAASGDAPQLVHNLRRLRDAKKLSQAELAERASLSRVAYGAIESGAAKPRVQTLLRIAQALDVPLKELMAPVRVLKAVHFRAHKRMTSREQILIDAARWLDNYNELERLVDDHIALAFDPLLRSLAERRPGRPRALAAAEQARQALGLRKDDSIRDLCGLLEERGGIKVHPLRLLSDAFFGLSVAREEGGPAIVVNVWERISVERWIFTAAHELGHLLLHLGAYDVSKTEEDPAEEAEADQFASHFLMPDDLFWQEWNEARGLPLIERVFKVKRIFRVSYKTVLYRLSEQETYGKEIWQRFETDYQRAYGQPLLVADEPERLPPEHFQAAMQTAMVEPRAAGEPVRLDHAEFVEDRLSRLVRTALEKEAISLGRAAEILQVDLRTMRARIASWVA